MSERPRRHRLTVLVGVAAGLLGLIVGGLTVVAAQDSGQVINACVNNRTGAVRIVDDPASCTANGKNAETALSWNQQGPQGPIGPEGPQGPSGSVTNCIGYPHEGIDWHGCDLRGARLTWQMLNGANLSGANLERARLLGNQLREADLSGANLSNAFFGDPDVNKIFSLYDSNDLYRANLTGSIMAGVTFAYGVSLTEANLTNTDLQNSTWYQGLVQGADLSNADLRNSTLGPQYLVLFDQSNLTNADLSYSTLGSVVFQHSDLSGANFTGATLGNTTWQNTICPDGTNSDGNGGTCIGHL